MPHINSLVYDFEGKSPESVMVPHVVCSVLPTNSRQPRYHGVFPLDTGARSDITFHSRLKEQIAQRSDTIRYDLSVGVGPLSAIRQKQQTYHADHQQHVGELDEGRVLAPQTLVAGSRRDGRTTLSLKALKLAGRCAVVDPAGDYPVVIADYGGAKSVYSTDVQFANNLEGFEFQLSCGKDRIDTLATTNFMPPARWLRNKKADDMGPVLKGLSKKAVCWDTGAAYSTFPGALFKAWELGRVAAENIGIIDEISFLTKDKHTLLRCRNVPVRLDDEEIIIGAPILNLFRMGFDPNGARIGLSIVWRQKWNLVPVEFETDRDLGTFISWKKPQPV